jgi:aromatic-amino-acid transaminase
MMATGTKSAHILEALRDEQPDQLLALIDDYRRDAREDKIDLGVGVYRDEAGETPVLDAVKAAERRILETQSSKSYLGSEGDPTFTAAVTRLALGAGLASDARVTGVQTPGGTGALRLAAEVAARGDCGRVWLGEPSWPNHAPIFSAAGLPVVAFRSVDPGSGRFDLAVALEALSEARLGDCALLQASCHNPTGADPDVDQWREIGRLLAQRGVLPILDLAYQGLGDGIEQDARGLRAVLEETGQALIAYSCNKNFGLYRERVGALIGVAAGPSAAARLKANMLVLTRALWSMPPDHGAAVVRTILSDPALESCWLRELSMMRERLRSIRRTVAAGHPLLEPIGRQRGLFSMLPITPVQVVELRTRHGIHAAPSGRANLAGLSRTNVERFLRSLEAVVEQRQW